jgi:hypothetical protein
MTRQWPIATAATLALALLFTFPGFLPGRVLLPLDHPRDLGAWKADPESRFEISNKIVSDPIYEYLAWDMEIRRLIRSGEMPWRNRWAGDGAHLYANPETALLFPFTWPRLLFGDNGWVLMALLKLWAGGLGMWWLARLLGAEWPYALVGSAAYAASGYMTMWLLFPHTNVYATLPWLAGCAVQFLRGPSRRWAAGVIATAALATAGGHPETLFHGVIGIAIFLFFVGRGRRLAMAGVLAFAGFTMIAVQLVPFAAALAKSDIVQTRSAAERHSVRVHAAIAQVLPGYLGSPLRGEIDLSGIAQPEAENFNERNAGYAGAITLIIIALAWRKLSRTLKAGVIIGIASLVAGWKLPLIDDALRALPLFDVAANERFPLVFVFFASAALPSALMVIVAENRRKRFGIALAVVSIALALAAAAPAVPAGRDLLVRGARSGMTRMQERGFLRKPPSYYEERLQHYLEGLRVVAVRRVAVPMLLIGVAGIALASSRRRSAVIGAAIAAEMIVFAWGYAPAVHRDDAAKMPASIAAIRRLDPSNEYLIAASTGVYDANLGTFHRVRDIRSYDVLQEHPRITRLAAMGYDRDSRGFPLELSLDSVRGLAAGGVRFFLSRSEPPSSARVGGSASPGVGVYELPGAVPTPRPSNSPPAGLLLGALISAAAVAGSVALVALVPYHRL